LVHAPIIATSSAVVALAAYAVDPSKPDPLTQQSTICNLRTKLYDFTYAFVAGDFIVMRIIARVNVNVRIARVHPEGWLKSAIG
jgi:hypothetical protein